MKDGVVTREGKTAGGRGGAGPYPIGYGALVPKKEDCDNLFVTFALSASHTAFSSLRMEPVFMVTSQSAATAACMAIDSDIPVQEVAYGALRERLLADGQILEWPPGPELLGIVLDDTEAQYTGKWLTSNAASSNIGGSYRHDGGRDRGQKTATFTMDIPADGDYGVRFYYTPHANRSTKTAVTIHHADGDTTVLVNQREPARVDGVAPTLGQFRFATDQKALVTITNEGADGYVVVDGIQLLEASTSSR